MNAAHVLAALGLAAGASAQVITTPGITATLDLTWQEDPAFAHNDNGVLEPGERALLLMSESFTGQSTLVTVSPPIAEHTVGLLFGFGIAYVDIASLSPDASGLYNNGLTLPASTSTGPNSSSAGTSGYGVRGGWRIGGNRANGQPALNGFISVAPGQLTTEPEVWRSDNPISNIDRLGWLPTSFDPRTVTFSVRPSASAGADALGLVLEFDGPDFRIGYLPPASISYGSVDIPIAPSPGGLVVLGMSTALIRRGRGPRMQEVPV